MVAFYVARNGVQLKTKVDLLTHEGISKNDLYLFALSKERAEELNETLHISMVGTSEQGVIGGIKNAFSSREKELKNQLASLDLEDDTINRLYFELNQGNLVLVRIDA